MGVDIPKVSILVPIYKVPEKLLRNCIESCINQTLSEIEIILVDDGSPDNCGLICDEYKAKDDRILVIHKENAGLAAARNSAFDVAKGEYITFLDGDDYLELKACEVAYNHAVQKNVQVVMWNQYTEYASSSNLIRSFGEEPMEFRNEECKTLQARVLDFNGKIAQVFSKLIKRDFMVEHSIRHIDSLKQGAEGFIFNIALFEYAESAYYIPDALLHYIYNEKSISHTPNEENYYMILRCFEYIENYIQSSKNKDILQKNLYNRMLYVIVTTGITGYFNPENKESYSTKVEKYQKFLSHPLLIESMKKASYEGVSLQRKFILLCVRYKLFCVVAILGRVRRVQLGKR
ncbi:glycosyltransferase [Enterococcus faecium]|nr:glycosyltransferase [Enterococcus faecium]